MWFPLAFMSLVQTIAGMPNEPQELIISVSINGYSEFYTDYSAGDHLESWNTSNYENLTKEFENNLGAQQFISRYDASDIYTAKLKKHSDSLWPITRPQRDSLLKLLKKGNETTGVVQLNVEYRVRRKPKQYTKQYESARGNSITMLNSEQCMQLHRIIENPYLNENVKIEGAIPHYIRGTVVHHLKCLSFFFNSRWNIDWFFKVDIFFKFSGAAKIVFLLQWAIFYTEIVLPLNVSAS
jgi:hypothetical protein